MSRSDEALALRMRNAARDLSPVQAIAADCAVLARRCHPQGE
jgi:hypothetical protein